MQDFTSAGLLCEVSSVWLESQWDFAEVGKGAQSLQTCCKSGAACAVKALAPTCTGNSGLASQALRFREGWCMLCVTSIQYTDFYTWKYSKSWRKLFFFWWGWSLEFKELCAFHFRNLKKCVQIVVSGKVC